MQQAIDAIAHPGRRAMLRLVLDREHFLGALRDASGVAQG
jgi:hypothetical protein